MVIGGPVVEAVLRVKPKGHEWHYAFVIDRDRYSAGGSRVTERMLAHPIATPERMPRVVAQGKTVTDEVKIVDVMLGDRDLLVYAWSEDDVEVVELELKP